MPETSNITNCKASSRTLTRLPRTSSKPKKPPVITCQETHLRKRMIDLYNLQQLAKVDNPYILLTN